MDILTPHPLTQAEEQQICAWRYDGEYAVYNLPPYETMLQQRRGFCNPQRSGDYAAWRLGEQLVGFTNLLEEDRAVFVGIGVKPELCGQGYGRRILEALYPLSKHLYPGKPLYLEVRTWNRRAIRCYQRAGFRVDGAPFSQVTSMGEGTFYRMVRA